MFRLLGVLPSKTEKMIGSYSSSEKILEKVLSHEEAPSNLSACGRYDIASRFVSGEEEEVVHLEWNWKLEVKEGW
jgi:hypothetical protein